MSSTPSSLLRSAWLLAALTGAATGCGQDVVLGDGRATLDRARDGGDASDDASTSIDTSPPDAGGDNADLSGAVPRFMDPVAIAELAGDPEHDDDDPSLNREQTWIFFSSKRDGGLGGEDVWFARRDSLTESWGTPEPATALNSGARETGVALSADGLTIYWSSDREGGQGGLDIYGASRTSPGASWSAPRPIDALNSSGDDLVSALADAGRRVLFARRDGDDGYAPWWAERPSGDATWSAPEPIDELGDSSDPFLVGDGTRILFTRGGDIQLAQRPDADAPFGQAQALDSLNSEETDTDAWTNEDLSYVVFASSRGGGPQRLYEARLAQEP